MIRHGFEFGFDPAGWFSKGTRKRMWFGSGDMKYVILKVLKEKPMHGYEVMKTLEEETGGCYKPSPGTVSVRLKAGRAGVELTVDGAREVVRFRR